MICFAQFRLPRIRDFNNCSFNRLISGSTKISMLSTTEQRYHLIFQRAREPQQLKILQELTPQSLLDQASVLSTRLIQRHKLPTAQAYLLKRIRWMALRALLCHRLQRNLITKTNSLSRMTSCSWIEDWEVVGVPTYIMIPLKFLSLSMAHPHIKETLTQLWWKVQGMPSHKRRLICLWPRM